MTPLVAFFNVGPPEMIILAVVAVLLFGKRLPEVGRSLGKGLIEFKKGLQGIEEDIDMSSSRRPPAPWRANVEHEPTPDAAANTAQMPAPSGPTDPLQAS